MEIISTLTEGVCRSFHGSFQSTTFQSKPSTTAITFRFHLTGSSVTPHILKSIPKRNLRTAGAYRQSNQQC